jgi:tetratricopeptide (TPR) repeat protein
MSIQTDILEGLDAIAAAVEAMEEEVFQAEAWSLLAYAYQELGEEARSLALARQAAAQAPPSEKAARPRARVLTRCAEVEARQKTVLAEERTRAALEAIRSAERQATSSAATADALNRWLHQLGQYGLAELRRELLPEALEFVEELSLSRQGVIIDTCDEALAGVGAGPWAEQRLRQVLQEATAATDLFSLGCAFHAWRGQRHGAALEPELGERLTALLLEVDPQVNEINIHGLDEGVQVLGKPLVEGLFRVVGGWGWWVSRRNGTASVPYTNSPIHQLTNSSTHQPANAPTHRRPP